MNFCWQVFQRTPASKIIVEHLHHLGMIGDVVPLQTHVQSNHARNIFQEGGTLPSLS
jgi:hypothetical protein